MPRETKASSDPPALAVKRRLGINELMIKKKRTWRQVKQLVSAEYFDLLPATAPTYSSIDAPPSMLPSKKYCDITGFPVCLQPSLYYSLRTLLCNIYILPCCIYTSFTLTNSQHYLNLQLSPFQAKYTDPKTKLRFCTPEAFRFARSIPEHRVEELLSLRQAGVRIK